MAYTVTIQGQELSLPEVSASPNWAPGQVAFNKAVANALQFTVGTYDVPPTTYQMVSNVNTDVEIGGLAFPTSEIRGVFLYYTVYRTTSTSNEAEAGMITIVYNPNNSVNNKWEKVQQFCGSSTVVFSITDSGQVTFSSTSLSGSNHAGTIGYYAKVIQQLY